MAAFNDIIKEALREPREQEDEKQRQQLRKEMAAAMLHLLEFEYQNRKDEHTRKGLNCISHLEFNFKRWKKDPNPLTNEFGSKMNLHFRMYELMKDLEKC